VDCHSIDSVFVPPEHRCKGYATLLVKLLREHLISEARGQPWVVSNLYSDVGPKFYSRFGWKVFESREWVIRVPSSISCSAPREDQRQGQRCLENGDLGEKGSAEPDIVTATRSILGDEWCLVSLSGGQLYCHPVKGGNYFKCNVDAFEKAETERAMTRLDGPKPQHNTVIPDVPDSKMADCFFPLNFTPLSPTPSEEDNFVLAQPPSPYLPLTPSSSSCHVSSEETPVSSMSVSSTSCISPDDSLTPRANINITLIPTVDSLLWHWCRSSFYIDLYSLPKFNWVGIARCDPGTQHMQEFLFWALDVPARKLMVLHCNVQQLDLWNTKLKEFLLRMAALYKMETVTVWDSDPELAIYFTTPPPLPFSSHPPAEPQWLLQDRVDSLSSLALWRSTSNEEGESHQVNWEWNNKMFWV
jgi:hypothetical protein